MICIPFLFFLIPSRHHFSHYSPILNQMNPSKSYLFKQQTQNIIFVNQEDAHKTDDEIRLEFKRKRQQSIQQQLVYLFILLFPFNRKEMNNSFPVFYSRFTPSLRLFLYFL